jgi:hypothetical protein
MQEYKSIGVINIRKMFEDSAYQDVSVAQMLDR